MSSEWKDNLREALQGGGRRQAAAEMTLAEFFDNVVMPAYDQIGAELRKHGREVKIRASEASAALTVTHAGDEELSYRVQGRVFPHGVRPFAEIRFKERNGLRRLTVEQMIRSGVPDYTLGDIAVQDIINHFLEQYTSKVRSVE